MSIAAMAWALKQNVGSATRKLVLLAIANYADENGKCWPSQERLCQDTELGERSIRDALKSLEADGFLTRTSRYINGNKRQTDIIQLTARQRQEMPVAPPANGSKNHRQMAPKPAAGDAGKPLVEPSKGEPSARGADAPAGQIIPFPSVDEPRKEKRLSRMPADFTLTAERIAFARKEGLTDETARREFEKFAGHHGAKGSKFLDWDLAWQNWVRKAADGFGGTGRVAAGGHGSQGGSLLRAYQRAASRFNDPLDDAQ